MSKLNVEITQNAEISKKLPCEKSLIEQLEIMEEYTNVHKSSLCLSKEQREINCLKVIYPKMFRSIQKGDRLAGRLDFLPIGFGCVTSVGGVGHYCVFAKLRDFQKKLPEAEQPRVDSLYDYWLNHDTKTLYCKDILNDSTIGAFIDCRYPLIATARLSGMMLDYEKLVNKGICGLRQEILLHLEKESTNEFLKAGLQTLDLFTKSAEYLKEKAVSQADNTDDTVYKNQLLEIAENLDFIKDKAPETFHQALQLFWLYAMLAGVINYGRLDDVLGPFLARDLEKGILTENQAFEILKNLWTMIENRRTTVNGRIIVGGKGRKHPKEADIFTRLAMKVADACRYVEPQFTLRFDHNTPQDIMDSAYDLLGKNATYPTLYNDDVEVPAVSYGMRLDEKTAEQYVPFGCTEFVIQGQSTGTPNVCINLLKILTILLNEGIDPTDGIKKCGPVFCPPLSSYKSFDQLYAKYKELLQHFIDLSIYCQTYSYKIMNEHVSFMFTSILMDDCIGRGKALLDGGVKYLGGTNETYGNINTSDSLYAIKKLVFDDKKYTLEQLEKACLENFDGVENQKIRQDCMACEKYGNDEDEVDNLADDLYEFVAKGVRQTGIDAGMQYYLIVISNNQVNTEWGRKTSASPDGRLCGMYMNPANNPQAGGSKKGPTAMLNSLKKFDAKYHAGSVQSIKFTPKMFNEHRDVIKALFKTYFDGGGSHLMITCVDKGTLEDAVIHPEKYPNLLVRVSGFSAVFVDLAPDVQQEVISRCLFE